MATEPKTAQEMLPSIGTTARVRFESLLVECTVRDVKNSYGRTRFLIEPVAGIGQQWVELSRLIQIDQKVVL